MATANFFDQLDEKVNHLTTLVLDIKHKPEPQTNIPSTHPQKYGNAKDAAKRYGVHPNTIRNWHKQGHIHKHTVDGVSLYSFDEIDQFIQSKAI